MKVIILFFLLISCSTSLNKRGIGVRVVNDASLVQSCKFVQSIESSSSWGGFAATGVGYRSAMNELKNEAGNLGANTILISTISNTMGGTNMSGDAYQCTPTSNEAPTMQLAPPPQ